MTDKLNEDALDSAVDAVLTGQATSGPDAHTVAIARLANLLRGMPSPEFKSRLAAELFPQPPSFLGRIPVLNRIRSRRLAAPLALTTAVAIAAIALAAIIVNPFSGSTGSTAEAFGDLPVPEATVSAPVAGGTGAITWQLDAGLVLPDSAPAYRLAMKIVSAERAEQIAQAVGVDGALVPLSDDNGGAAGYHAGASIDCKPLPGEPCGPSFEIWTNGWFAYRSGELAGGGAPADAIAKAAAAAWIDASGVTSGDAYELTVQPPPAYPEKPGDVPQGDGATSYPAQVTAQPAGHSGPENGPIIFLTIQADGTVTDAGGFWARIAAESGYGLRSREQLKADLDAVRGTFGELGVDGGALAQADVTKAATATVASVILTYQPAAEADGQVYLVPMYTLKSSLLQDGHSVADFNTSVPATGPTR